jgi:nucleoside-diphosphate-sugar epimerase
MKPRVFVTGAAGFIGSWLCRDLIDICDVSGAVRSESDAARLPEGVECVPTGDLAAAPDLSRVLRGIDVVIHLAARVHMLNDEEKDPLTAFRKTNVDATLHLARAAVDAGVKQFIFLSSIGVNGGDSGDRAFDETDTPRPHTPYAQSKLEAEQGLNELAAASGMVVTIIRPPLVYGPDAPGNLARLVTAVRAGLPLPLGSVRNQRSFVFVGNLVSAIRNIVVTPPTAGMTYLIADRDAVSTPELIRMIARAVGRKPRLVPVPVPPLKLIARLAGKSREVDQLVGSLRVSSDKFRQTRAWEPPTSLGEGLALSLRSDPR